MSASSSPALYTSADVRLTEPGISTVNLPPFLIFSFVISTNSRFGESVALRKFSRVGSVTMAPRRPCAVPMLFLIRNASTAAAKTPMSSSGITREASELRVSWTPNVGAVGSGLTDKLRAPVSSRTSSRLASVFATASAKSSGRSSSVSRNNLLVAASSSKTYFVRFLVPWIARQNLTMFSRTPVTSPKRIPEYAFLASFMSGESLSRVRQSDGKNDQVLGQLSWRNASKLSSTSLREEATSTPAPTPRSSPMLPNPLKTLLRCRLAGRVVFSFAAAPPATLRVMINGRTNPEMLRTASTALFSYFCALGMFTPGILLIWSVIKSLRPAPGAAKVSKTVSTKPTLRFNPG